MPSSANIYVVVYNKTVADKYFEKHHQLLCSCLESCFWKVEVEILKAYLCYIEKYVLTVNYVCMVMQDRSNSVHV